LLVVAVEVALVMLEEAVQEVWLLLDQLLLLLSRTL
jgi:hypothetical protein